MRKFIYFVVAAAILMLPTLGFGQVKTDPKEIVVGVIQISLNSEYVMLEVDGASWEDFFFEDDGMTLLIEGIDRTKEHKLKLTPTNDELKMLELVVKPKEWKLARLDKETRQWRFEKKLKFAKWKPGEKEKLEEDQRKKQEEAEKKAEEDAKKAEEAPEKPETPERPDAPAPDNPDEAPAPPTDAPAEEPPAKNEK